MSAVSAKWLRWAICKHSAIAKVKRAQVNAVCVAVWAHVAFLKIVAPVWACFALRLIQHVLELPRATRETRGLAKNVIVCPRRTRLRQHGRIGTMTSHRTFNACGCARLGLIPAEFTPQARGRAVLADLIVERSSRAKLTCFNAGDSIVSSCRTGETRSGFRRIGARTTAGTRLHISDGKVGGGREDSTFMGLAKRMGGGDGDMVVVA